MASNLAREGMGDKGKPHFSEAWKLMRGFFQTDLIDLKLLVPVSVSYGVLTLTVPLGVQVLVNRILSTALASQAVSIVALVSIGLIAAAFLRIVQRSIVERIQRRFHSRMTLFASEAPSEADGFKISHRYFDTFIVQKSLSTLLMEGVGVVVQLLFALTLLAFYHPFFLAFDLLIVIGLVVVVGLPASHLMGTAISESKSKHETAKFLGELARESSRDARLTAADEIALNYLVKRKSHFDSIVVQMIGLSGLHIVFNALLLGFGSLFVIRQQMSLGQLIAAELVFSAAFLSVEKLNKHLEVFYDMVAALEKLSAIAGMGNGARYE